MLLCIDCELPVKPYKQHIQERPDVCECCAVVNYGADLIEDQAFEAMMTKKSKKRDMFSELLDGVEHLKAQRADIS